MSGTKSQHFNISRLVLQLSLPNPLKPGVKSSEDVVGAAPTGDAPAGDAPITSEWSKNLLPTKVRLILEALRYVVFNVSSDDFLQPSHHCDWWCPTT